MGLHQFEDLEIDLDRRAVRRSGEALTVAGLNFDVLAALMDVAPRPLGANELAAQAWGLDHVSEDTLARRIGLLREALGDDARQPRYVRTVRGVGYALAGPVERSSRPVLARARRFWPAAGLAASIAVAAVLGGAMIAPSEDYQLVLVDGRSGAVSRQIVTDAPNAQSLELVASEDGSVVLQTPVGAEADQIQADALVRLAERHLTSGSGDPALARRYLEAALSLDPVNPAAQDRLRRLTERG